MYLSEFLNHLQKVRCYSLRTVQSYRNNIELFCKYLSSLNKDIDNLNPNDVGLYVEFLMERGIKPKSINQYLASFRSYYDYCIRFQGMKRNPAAYIHDVRTPKLLPKFITENKMNDLIENHLPKDDFKRMRSRIIILIFYHTGIRCHELSLLRVKDINFENDTMRIFGKGNKERIIPFGNELHNELLQYIEMRKELNVFDENLILTVYGTACTDFHIRVITKMVLRRIVSEDYAHPHVLRHTFATMLMNHGAKIENVKLLLGHSSINTTTIYQHVSINYLRNAYNKIFF